MYQQGYISGPFVSDVKTIPKATEHSKSRRSDICNYSIKLSNLKYNPKKTLKSFANSFTYLLIVFTKVLICQTFIVYMVLVLWLLFYYISDMMFNKNSKNKQEQPVL